MPSVVPWRAVSARAWHILGLGCLCRRHVAKQYGCFVFGFLLVQPDVQQHDAKRMPGALPSPSGGLLLFCAMRSACARARRLKKIKYRLGRLLKNAETQYPCGFQAFSCLWMDVFYPVPPCALSRSSVCAIPFRRVRYPVPPCVLSRSAVCAIPCIKNARTGRAFWSMDSSYAAFLRAMCRAWLLLGFLMT